MADGDGERIGCIGAELDFESQQLFDHVRDLRLLRAAHANHRELDGAWRVFVNAERGGHGRKRGAARLAELERAVGILGEEHALHGNFLRVVQPYELGDPGVDDAQAIGERAAGGGDATLRDDGESAGRAIDDAIAGAKRTGIETQDARGSAR